MMIVKHRGLPVKVNMTPIPPSRRVFLHPQIRQAQLLKDSSKRPNSLSIKYQFFGELEMCKKGHTGLWSCVYRGFYLLCSATNSFHFELIYVSESSLPIRHPRSKVPFVERHICVTYNHRDTDFTVGLVIYYRLLIMTLNNSKNP